MLPTLFWLCNNYRTLKSATLKHNPLVHTDLSTLSAHLPTIFGTDKKGNCN